jgi:pullulanase
MRKEQRFEAYLDDYNLITVYLTKQHYQGISDIFYLRAEDGTLHKLTIKYNENTSNDYSKYIITGCDFIEFGKYYDVIEEHGLTTPLQIGLIVKKDKFDQDFYYEKDDLGVNVEESKTTFSLWAPTAIQVRVHVEFKGQEETISLERKDKGVYSVSIDKNLHLATYTYFVFVNGDWVETIDPYGKSSLANATKSVVIDSKVCSVEDQQHNLPDFKNATDAIIMEMSVRDFTMDPVGNNSNPGTYLGFIEKNTTTNEKTITGFDYLLTLGVTHIQLLPVFDFATIDELNVETFYNWGYDPLQFNTPEGSYATKPNNPCSRVIELKQLISECHKNGLRVIMDAVYNHVYDMHQSSFEKIVPYYYFRRSESGAISNGSYCGNDFDSNRLMARKFIVDSCVMWINEYGFDGFRFDLMGILDIETMNLIDQKVRDIKPNALLYGEGWNMPTILDEDKKAIKENQLDMPNIGHFNDFFRDHVKGRTAESEISVKGYCTGDVNYAEAMKMCLVGNSLEEPFVHLFDQPTKSINYVECHDNRTSWDKIKECCKEDQRDVRLRKHKMMIAALCVAQGVPFFHSGQEFCRTKNGVHNSFRSGDLINQIDWNRKDRYQEVVNYTKDMIQLRKLLSVFRFESSEQIKKHVYFKDLEQHVLLYGFKNVKKYVDFNEVLVFFNPTREVVYHCLDDYGTLIANEAGLIDQIKVQCVTINPFTMVVLGK